MRAVAGAPGRPKSVGGPRRAAAGGRRAARRPWFLALLVLLASAAVAGLWLGGVLRTGPGRGQAVPSRPVAAVQAEAATWIAGQVGSDAMVACDPGICAALAARGVAPGRLVLLRRPGSARTLGPGIIVASAAIPDRLVREYAPALIASFGPGRDRLDIRETVTGGAAAYAAALRADRAARLGAGSELLQNRRITFTRQAAAQLRAGDVDSRLLVTLAAMSARSSFRVAGFSDTSPGAQVLFRAMAITGRRAGPAGLAIARATVSAQGSPYRPARVSVTRPPAGPATLRIEFAAPGPLGLLTPVLTVDPQPAAARPAALPETVITHPRGY
jgi:hypothetical protein